jgi:hypothetical protein
MDFLSVITLSEEKTNCTKLVASVVSLSCEDFNERKSCVKKKNPYLSEEETETLSTATQKQGLFKRRNKTSERRTSTCLKRKPNTTLSIATQK